MLKVAAYRDHGRVVGAKGRLTDRQRPLQLGLSPGQVPTGPRTLPRLPRQIATLGWSGAKRRLTDRYRSLGLRPATSQIAKPTKRAAKLVVRHSAGHLRMSASRGPDEETVITQAGRASPSQRRHSGRRLFSAMATRSPHPLPLHLRAQAQRGRRVDAVAS
jgi:hypothetical protein